MPTKLGMLATTMTRSKEQELPQYDSKSTHVFRLPLARLARKPVGMCSLVIGRLEIVKLLRREVYLRSWHTIVPRVTVVLDTLFRPVNRLAAFDSCIVGGTSFRTECSCHKPND